MDKKLREIFEKSDVDVFFCDKETKAITWSNRADVRKSGTKSVTEFFEGGKFPETTGIVNGIIGGRPYRYNIIETDDCFIVEILNKNISLLLHPPGEQRGHAGQQQLCKL